MPKPDRDEDFIVYYPTIRHYLLSGGDLNTEYKQAKALKNGYGKNQSRVTKQLSVLKAKLEANTDIDDIILVSHGDQNVTTMRGGSWLFTPMPEAQGIAQSILNTVTLRTLTNKKIWLWICHSSNSGVGAVFKATLGNVPGLEVYAAVGAVGGLAYWMGVDEDVITNNSFVLVPAAA
jgi:hypothetical protein